MRRKINLILVIMLLGAIVTCCRTEENDSDKIKVNENIKVDNFTGACGYILENQLWDYSTRFDKVYEWTA